jgi:hypothetical protein
MQTLALSLFMLALASLAQAQATRTWVSGVGDDVNPCSRTAPCKTFAGAISKTAAGGEIDALDPGGFGTLTITKSLLVDGTHGGGFGGVLNAGGVNGMVVNDVNGAAPGTSDVTLRNLSINGGGSTTLGLNGIRFIRGRSLRVEHCRITNQSSHGIDINNITDVGEVTVIDTIISNCAGSGIRQSAGSVLTQIRSSSVTDCGTGITNDAGLLNVSDTLVSGCTGHGIVATTGSAVVNATGNTVNNNGSAGIANTAGVAGCTVRVSDNDVFRNGTGLQNNIGGTMETFRNNRVRGNTVSNVTGTLTDVSAVGTGIQ